MGTAMILPTGAAATLVLTGAAASLAASALPARSRSLTPTALSITPAALSLAPPVTTASSGSAAARGAAEARAGRTDQAGMERAARAADRARLDLRTAEQRRRAAAETTFRRTTQRIVALTGTPGGAKGSHTWVRPISNYVKTSGFGQRWGKMHPAQDFAAPVGTIVRSISSGRVTLSVYEGSYGNKIEITHWDGTVSWYCHLDQRTVQVGQEVGAGQIIARSGNTGNSTGPHLHFEIHPTATTEVDPVAWLRGKGVNV